MAFGSPARLRFASMSADAGLIGFMQNRIGADEAKPAFKILAVLRQTRGEPLDHAANDIHLPGCRQRLDLSCHGPFCGALRLAAERRYPFAQRLRPRRVLRRFGDELAPNVPCPGTVSFLLGGKTEKEPGLSG